MATVRHLSVTLNGSAQRISTSLNESIEDDFILQAWLQPDAANGNPVYLGGVGVSASSYGVRMEAPDMGIPPAPFSPGDLFPPVAANLGDFYVIGTNTEILRVLVIGYPKSS